MSGELIGIEFLVCEVANLWRKAYNEACKELSLTVCERRLLSLLGRHEKATQTELANYLDLEPQNMVRLLDQLEEKKFIERHACELDRRVKRIGLTKEGKKQVKNIKVIGDTLRPLMTGALSTAELRELEQGLQRLSAALQKHLIK